MKTEPPASPYVSAQKPYNSPQKPVALSEKLQSKAVDLTNRFQIRKMEVMDLTGDSDDDD